MELIRSHDGLFRFVFGEPEQMADLLRSCLPGAVVDAIAWPTLRRVPGSFVDKELRERVTDLLFAARMENVTVLLHILCEHKSKDDRFTALQVARYVVRIHDHWLARHPDSTELPAVLPFVLYHGDKPWAAPRSPHELIDLSGCAPEVVTFLRPLQLHQPFHLLDLATLTEQQIDDMRLSAAGSLTLRFLQFLRRCNPDQFADSILRWQHLVTRMLEHPRGKDVLSALFSWYLAGAPASHETLRTVMTKIHEENPPMRSCLDLLLEMNEERGLQKGLEMGEERGVQKGLRAMRAMLEGRLRARFGVVPADTLERLAAADAESLQRWGLRVLAATRLDEVFADG